MATIKFVQNDKIFKKHSKKPQKKHLFFRFFPHITNLVLD